ncbi:MAG: hypothetical protein LBI42_09570 [Chitinispirillales bacterium]|jgi:hypothetical protein|nr:hypothetical protein [Chitinispirillales bacterium]
MQNTEELAIKIKARIENDGNNDLIAKEYIFQRLIEHMDMYEITDRCLAQPYLKLRILYHNRNDVKKTILRQAVMDVLEKTPANIDHYLWEKKGVCFEICCTCAQLLDIIFLSDYRRMCFYRKKDMEILDAYQTALSF